jgi:short-subunit dehydrogenase
MNLRRQGELVAVVTGASSGIGQATALRLGARGVNVVLASRRKEKLRQVADQITAAGGMASVAQVDVSDRGQIQRLVAEVLSRHGAIDILIANAGTYVRGPVTSLAPEDFARSMKVNFSGALDLIYEVLPHMLARRRGHIVAVSTVDAKKGLPCDAPYVAAKAALTGFMDVLRQELRGSGVYASTILPGRVDTPMIDFLTVPLISRKISPGTVAKALVRAIEKNSAEVVIPRLGPRALIVLAACSAALGDFIVRTLRLEGKTQSQ